MSFYAHPGSGPYHFGSLEKSFLQHSGLPFADVLDADTIQQAFDDEDASFGEEDDAVFTPALTLWAFLSQVLHKEEQRSCRAAVARVITLLVASGLEACSEDTGAYCRARAKLSETVLERLTTDVAKGCETELPRKWLWRGRHVQLVDGTTVSMPDTEENQEAYPQHTAQKPGLGFPIARLVVLLSLSTAMVSGMALGPYAGKETGETALFRQLLNALNKGDVLLADRYFCSYFMIALLREAGIDVAVISCAKPIFVAGVAWAKAIMWWSGRARPNRIGWTKKRISACRSRSKCAKSKSASSRRASGSNPSSSSPACSTQANTPATTSPNCTTNVGWWSWTSAPSRSTWAWTSCVARRPRWSARRSGLACWLTI